MRRLLLIGALFALAIIAGCSQSSSSSSNENQEKTNGDNNPDTTTSDSTNSVAPESQQSFLENFNWSEVSSTEDAESNNEPRMIPASISIPSINVEANIEKVGKLSNGQMDVPKEVENVGWYELGAQPGEKGSAVMAGHVDGREGPAVFFDLAKLKKGELIHIIDDNGKKLTFKIYDMKNYQKDNAPINEIFGYSAAETLKLITCTGDFLEDEGTYDDRLVVSAQLVDKN